MDYWMYHSRSNWSKGRRSSGETPLTFDHPQRGPCFPAAALNRSIAQGRRIATTISATWKADRQDGSQSSSGTRILASLSCTFLRSLQECATANQKIALVSRDSQNGSWSSATFGYCKPVHCLINSNHQPDDDMAIETVFMGYLVSSVAPLWGLFFCHLYRGLHASPQTQEWQRVLLGGPIMWCIDFWHVPCQKIGEEFRLRVSQGCIYCIIWHHMASYGIIWHDDIHMGMDQYLFSYHF